LNQVFGSQKDGSIEYGVSDVQIRLNEKIALHLWRIKKERPQTSQHPLILYSPLPLSSLGELTDWRKWLAMVFVGIMLVSSMSLFNVTSQDSKRALSLSYTSHAPIVITDNSQFIAANGVASGSGTASDPYTIEGWDINATSSEGVNILGTTAHFILRNCRIHDGSPAGHVGIHLDNCSNGVLINNDCLRNFFGIWLSASSNNTLFGNNCSHHARGIQLTSSNNNTLIDNNCLFHTGIGLDSSNDNILQGNNCNSSGGFGIVLESSNGNSIRDNDISSKNDGLVLISSSNNILSNNNCSLNNGNGIYLTQSGNNTISDNNCSGSLLSGMRLDSSDNNIILNNICNLNGEYGVYLYQLNPPAYYSPGRNNSIHGNWICNNTNLGIKIANGSNNHIWNNAFINNLGANTTYDLSRIQAYDNGTGNYWNMSGTIGWGNYWCDWRSPDTNADGIVDKPYNISGGALNKDWYPLVSSSKIDNSPPVTDISTLGIVGANGWYTSNVTVYLNASDSGSGINRTLYQIENGSWIRYLGPFTIASNGKYELSYYSIDSVRNDETEKSVQIKIDKTPPLSHASKSGTKITIAATDTVSGVNSTKYSIDGGAWSIYNATINISASGNHSIQFYSVDNAGNNESVKVIYLDNTSAGMTDMILITLVVVVLIIVILSSYVFLRKRKGKITEPPSSDQ
jgi:parallel beta-helix repeat protein